MFYWLFLLSKFDIYTGCCEFGSGITMEVTDSPPIDEADAVILSVKKIVAFIKSTEDDTVEEHLLYEPDQAEIIDFKDLVDGKTETLFENIKLPNGTYNGIRIYLTPNNNSITVNGTKHELILVPPIEEKAYLTIKHQFVIDEENPSLELIVELDMFRSIRKRGNNKYHLHRLLRAIRKNKIKHPIAEHEQLKENERYFLYLKTHELQDEKFDDEEKPIAENAVASTKCKKDKNGKLKCKFHHVEKGSYNLVSYNNNQFTIITSIEVE